MRHSAIRMKPKLVDVDVIVPVWDHVRGCNVEGLMFDMQIHIYIYIYTYICIYVCCGAHCVSLMVLRVCCETSFRDPMVRPLF